MRTATALEGLRDLVLDYNKHMGGSDGNDQHRANYSCDDHSDHRYWWKLFHIIIHSAALTAWLLYKPDYPDSKLEQNQFHRLIAVEYIHKLAGRTRVGL